MRDKRRDRSRVAGWLAALLLSGCGPRPAPGGGNAVIGVTTMGLSTNEVSRVEVTVQGPAIDDPLVHDLVAVAGQWQGFIGQIPAGSKRTFKGEAFDGGGKKLYVGKVTDVPIVAGQTTSVVLPLQQKRAPTPFENTVPQIEGLVASSQTIGPKQSVTLVLAASDPDGDKLSYRWNASGGSFDTKREAAVSWHAPKKQGLYTVTVEVSDRRGGSRAVSLTIDVAKKHAKGAANVEVSFNSWPTVTGLVATPGKVGLGQVAALALVVEDADGDPLSFAWSDPGGDCAGSFSDWTVEDPLWTAPAGVPTKGCRLAVVIEDGRGGGTSASVTLFVGPPHPANLAPVIESVFQSSSTPAPGETVSLRVTASDPEAGVLDFFWSASDGALGMASSTGISSETTWTAPITGCGQTVEVSVVDPLGGQVSYLFEVSICGA